MLVSKILENNVVGFNEEANARIQELLARKLVEMKQQVAFNLYGLDEEYELVEDEEVNELSKSTLSSYVDKAKTNKDNLSKAASYSGSKSTHAYRKGDNIAGRMFSRMSRDSSAKASKRDVGINRASDKLKEDENLDEAAVTGTKLSASGKRWKIVRVRVRKGSVQRNRKVTNTAGYTFRNSNKNRELIRMSPTERRNRKRGQKIGKIKRKAKMTQARLKRKRSDRKRKALGL